MINVIKKWFRASAIRGADNYRATKTEEASLLAPFHNRKLDH
jgi:hypothetical protein